MNEMQYNATRKAEAAARALAERFSLARPTFYVPHNDPEITANRALVAIGQFMESITTAQEPPAHVRTLKEAIATATIDELTSIPGIGPATAKRILQENSNGS